MADKRCDSPAMATPEGQRCCAVASNNIYLWLGGVSHKKLVIFYITTLLYQLCASCYVVCVQFSSIWRLPKGVNVCRSALTTTTTAAISLSHVMPTR